MVINWLLGAGFAPAKFPACVGLPGYSQSMSSRTSKARYGADNDPKVIEAERRRLEVSDEFNQLPEFMSRPEAFNDPSQKLRRTQMTALPFRLSPMQYKFAYEFIETGDAFGAYKTPDTRQTI